MATSWQPTETQTLSPDSGLPSVSLFSIWSVVVNLLRSRWLVFLSVEGAFQVCRGIAVAIQWQSNGNAGSLAAAVLVQCLKHHLVPHPSRDRPVSVPWDKPRENSIRQEMGGCSRWASCPDGTRFAPPGPPSSSAERPATRLRGDFEPRRTCPLDPASSASRGFPCLVCPPW
jgi:hypothetical protein